MRKISGQCQNNPVLVPPRKAPDPLKGVYEGQTHYLEKRVDIWTNMDVVPVEYRTFAHTFNFTMCFFQLITGIFFKWGYVLWYIISLLVWIGLWTKLTIYRVPSDPFIWSCRGFGYLWKAFILNWMVWTKNNLKVSHRKKVNSTSNKKMVTSLMNFECHPCGICEDLSYHQEDEAIDSTIFAANLGLVYRINKLVSSNFMVMVSSVSVIFYTKANYLYSSNKGDFVKLEEKMFPINIKFISKVLEISRFGIVEYYIKSESGHMIELRDQEYYVPGSPKDLHIIYLQGIHTSEVYKGNFIHHFHDEHDSYVELNLN